MYRNQERIYLFLLCSQLLGSLIFLYGFFPLTTSSGRMADVNSLPQKLEVSQFAVESLYKRRIGKLVLMVIDALRYDFISEEYMPFTTKMITESKAVLIKSRAHPPTVTLPRLKAMMTGTLPNYIDVILNFGSNRLMLDNIIKQVVNRTMNIVFYGDDTWLKLFPTEFIRKEGTVSFFVNDFTEVDMNVTRNLHIELGRNDWDFMILHYLGLDHIGHLEGPFSAYVKPKLKEMDLIVSEIIESLGEGDVLIVCGDHGMKDSGGHGGTSHPELLVPVVIFNYVSSCDDMPEGINQIDMAPFISFLFGIPIPADNIGKLHYCLLKQYDPYTILYALHYNAQQMGSLYINRYKKDDLMHEGFKVFLSAANLFDKWIQTMFTNQYNVSAIWLYERSLQVMSDDLIKIRAHFDMYSMMISVIIFVLVLAVILLKDVNVISLRSYFVLSITTLFVCIHFTICSVNSYNMGLCTLSLPHIACAVLVSFVLSVNINYVFRAPFKLKIPFSKHIIISIGVILQTLSLGSSSMIEEEHQVWYFVLVTMCLYFLYRTGLKKFLVMLIFHRVLRKLNQTGDKWAHLADIGDWLNLSENKVLLSVVYFTILVIIGAIAVCIFQQNSLKQTAVLKLLHFFLTVGLMLFIYCYRLAVGTVVFPLIDYPMSKGAAEVELFWIFLLVLVIIQLFAIPYNSLNKNAVKLQVLGLLFQTFCWIVCLLLRPHNSLLLPSLILFSCIFDACLKHDAVSLTAVQYLLGKVFFFYQGNSNSLASVDIGVGYTGLTNYNPLTTGSFLIVHTFAAPVLSYILLIYFLTNRGTFSKSRATIYRTILYILVQEMLFYSIVVILQRHHLFVWSVFSPKLLYLSAYIGLYGVLIFCTELLNCLANLSKNAIYQNL